MCKGLSAFPSNCLERAKELKARMNSFLQKQDWKLLCYAYNPRKPRLTLEECLAWKESFENLLSSKHGLYAFKAFLVSEFSEENIAFYLACKEFKNTKSEKKLQAKALRIYNEFIGSKAPREVNIDHDTRDITQANIKFPTVNCFDQAQYLIYMLMEKDCYPRFLRSGAYWHLVNRLSKKKRQSCYQESLSTLHP